MVLQLNNLSQLKSRLRSPPSRPRPRQRNRERSGTIDLSIKEKRSRFPNPSALLSLTNWLKSRPRITLYELLRLSKSTREALKEALADNEVFVTQLLTGLRIDEPKNLNISRIPASIDFTPEDMQV